MGVDLCCCYGTNTTVSKDDITHVSDGNTPSFMKFEKEVSENREKKGTSAQERSLFHEPISADLPRRQLDRKMLESFDSNQERIRNISSRVTRMEALFEHIAKDINKIEVLQKEMANNLEATVLGMNASTNKLAIHTEMEEFQWELVNKANDTLAKVGAALNDHLQASGSVDTRLNWLERLTWSLWGVVGAAVAMLVPLIFKGLSV